MRRFAPVTRVAHFLHGADYNPDQWHRTPEVIDEDIRLMKETNCNIMSVGIFSWTALEPEEGRYEFGWLDNVLDKLHAAGVGVALATPSGARPAWLARKYPEVLRVNANRTRNLYGQRHNHCYSSPAYRARVAAINRALAERYKDHPALLLWHVSNEYGGECHCPLCQENFRAWLKRKYGTLDALNEQYWTGFWSHTFTDWAEIESPSPIGDSTLHGLALDWRRFVTDMTADFMDAEAAPLREITPNIPITANLMGTYEGLDYTALARHMDVVSWDSYPAWRGTEEDVHTAMVEAFKHDLMYGLKRRPFLLMESTPSLVNWQAVSSVKRPGMHLLSAMQAVAHGADSVQYFQWRKSRGGSEKFHGAVVDHSGRDDTRVLGDVRRVGQALVGLDAVLGARAEAKVGLIFDWNNRWAQETAAALRNDKKTYVDTCMAHYAAFWRQGIAAELLGEEADFSPYTVLCAPMLYLLKPGVAQRLADFVAAGGTLVTTYWSGLVNENDLCFLGKGPLADVLGIRVEEIDTLADGRRVPVRVDTDRLPIGGRYDAALFCELSHLEGAEALAVYDGEFYAGMPAVTRNRYGKGRAYCLAFQGGQDFLNDFYRHVAGEAGLDNPLGTEIPEGVSVKARYDGDTAYVFVMNFGLAEATVTLPAGMADLLTGDTLAPGALALPPYGVRVLRRV